MHCVQTAWLLRAVTCIDLTTLSGDDVLPNINSLCQKALNPLHDSVVKRLSDKR